MNEIFKAIKSRRSIRAFRTEQIKQEEIDLLIEAGIYAPSAHNVQPWHFTVIQNREVIKHISDVAKEVMAEIEVDWIRKAGMNPELDITYKAPTLIIVSGRKDTASWKADCAAAIQNILIAAESINLGSNWLGFTTFCFRKEGEAEKIKIPEGYEPYYGIALGYKPNDVRTTVPTRRYDVVNYIR